MRARVFRSYLLFTCQAACPLHMLALARAMTVPRACIRPLRTRMLTHHHHLPGIAMTLCPIAIVASCAKCPVVTVCPLKTVIGDAPKVPPAKAAAKKK